MEDLRRILMTRRAKVGLERAVSTGCTLLNLAVTDQADAGYLPGGYYYLVGDSASGKTFLTLGCLAEASLNDRFKKYRLIYDDVEGGALMDLEKYFGKELARRLEPPRVSKKGRPVYSDTIESFYYNVQNALDEGYPFIYVLDSQDALTSDSSADKFALQKKAAETGKEAAGSYGDGKAKYHSEHLRQVLAGLRRSGSILLIVGQTRDNLGFGFEKKTRSGGRALRFYANVEIWTSVTGKIKKTINGKPRTLGVACMAEIRKNRVTGKTGKDRAVTFPIYYGLGVDDLGACVAFLIEEGHWPRVKRNRNGEAQKEKGPALYDAKEVLMQGSVAEILQAIEEDGLEGKVREAVASVWGAIEAECVPQRKKRYE